MKKITTTVISFAILITMLIGCGKNDTDVYLSKENSDYKTVDAVNGVIFSIPKDLTIAATALTKIDEEVEMDISTTYSYKDGQNNYMLFNMNNFVIVVTNEAEYNLEELNANAITEALENNYTLGVRADTLGKTLNYNKSSSNGISKFIAEVKSEVILTTEFYGNFVGKISYINQDEKEYSLFVGVIGEDYFSITEESKDIINYVSKSFKINETSSMLNTNIDVSENVTKSEELSESDIEEVIGDTLSENEIISENKTISENETVSENQSISENENVIEELPEKINEVPLPVDSEEIVSNNDIEEELESIENKSEGVTLTNQIVNKSDSKVKLSSIYSMLSIGESGYFNVFSSMSKKMETANVTVEEVITGEDAITLIKDYCCSNDAFYEYTEAQEGTSWQAVKYSVDYSTCTTTENYVPYVNIKILGVDGEKLNYRGISYTKKTHDIKYEAIKQGALYSNYYVFYEIPNGCPEYLLEVGEGTISNTQYGIISSYYLVK